MVAFVLTTGDVLDDAGQAAFQRYLRSGRGFVGVHSAADTEHDWPWYGRLVGAYFKSHPAIQPATVVVADPRHLSTAGLPRRWTRLDEWYNFAANPRPAVRVLATLDEATYSAGDGAMGPDHPIAWAHELDGGRAWYTGGGHTEESYSEPLFRSHLLGGIRYAAGLAPPSILAVATTLKSRRLAVAVRYADCRPCAARLAVRLAGPHARRPDAARRRTRRRDDGRPPRRNVDDRRDAREPAERTDGRRPASGSDPLARRMHDGSVIDAPPLPPPAIVAPAPARDLFRGRLRHGAGGHAAHRRPRRDARRRRQAAPRQVVLAQPPL